MNALNCRLSLLFMMIMLFTKAIRKLTARVLWAVWRKPGCISATNGEVHEVSTACPFHLQISCMFSTAAGVTISLTVMRNGQLRDGCKLGVGGILGYGHLDKLPSHSRRLGLHCVSPAPWYLSMQAFSLW